MNIFYPWLEEIHRFFVSDIDNKLRVVRPSWVQSIVRSGYDDLPAAITKLQDYAVPLRASPPITNGRPNKCLIAPLIGSYDHFGSRTCFAMKKKPEKPNQNKGG
jgi:hypothetical protein